MKNILLDKLDEWKRRRNSVANRDLIGYWVDGRGIMANLMNAGCSKDRENSDIKIQSDSAKEVIEELMKRDRDSG
jgi:hypothetical protein